MTTKKRIVALALAAALLAGCGGGDSDWETGWAEGITSGEVLGDRPASDDLSFCIMLTEDDAPIGVLLDVITEGSQDEFRTYMGAEHPDVVVTSSMLDRQGEIVLDVYLDDICA